MGHALQIFDEAAERYDAWYDSPTGRILLDAEVDCIRPLLEQFPKPYFEIGVGTGRFAEALSIERGIDPSLRAIEKARERGVEVVQGAGENIPFGDGAFGGILVAFTLCFVNDPQRMMQEIRRTLAPGGGVVLGLLLKGTPWAEHYARRGAKGHPLYGSAHFYSKDEITTLLEQAGFHITEYRSTLFQTPGLKSYDQEQPVQGYTPDAGFVGIAAVRDEVHSQMQR